MVTTTNVVGVENIGDGRNCRISRDLSGVVSLKTFEFRRYVINVNTVQLFHIYGIRYIHTYLRCHGFLLGKVPVNYLPLT